MKNILVFIVLTYLCAGMCAQNNLFIFSESGKKFTLFLDDKAVNTIPESSVECTSLIKRSYFVNISMNDTMVIKNTEVLLTWKSDTISRKDFTYVIKKTKTEYQLHFLYVNESFSDSISLDKRIEDMLVEIEKLKVLNDSLELEKPLTHFNEKGECILPLIDRDFTRAKNKLKLERFEDPKQRYLMKLISANCLTCAQLEVFLDLLNYEITRLQMVKFALPYLMDKENKFVFLTHFQFDAAKKDLDKYLKSH